MVENIENDINLIHHKTPNLRIWFEVIYLLSDDP